MPLPSEPMTFYAIVDMTLVKCYLMCQIKILPLYALVKGSWYLVMYQILHFEISQIIYGNFIFSK